MNAPLALQPSTPLQALAPGAWPAEAAELLRRQPGCVRVVVARLQGSAPREPGACLLLTADTQLGTIGGGRLEWLALQAARELLAEPRPARLRLRRFLLGRSLGQCCGGVVDLWFERYDRSDLGWLQALVLASADGPGLALSSLQQGDAVEHRWRPLEPGVEPQTVLAEDAALRLHEAILPQPRLWLFGAGHVGQALVRCIGELPLRLSWIDTRRELFPYPLPRAVGTLAPADPASVVAEASAATRYVVMTHDHALDYRIVCAALRRGDAAFVGLIGSQSKAARFRAQLARDGVDAAWIARLVCPLGQRPGRGKSPAAVAIDIAAQLLDSLTPVAAVAAGADAALREAAP